MEVVKLSEVEEAGSGQAVHDLEVGEKAPEYSD